MKTKLVAILFCLIPTTLLNAGIQDLLPKPVYYMATEASPKGFVFGDVHLIADCMQQEYGDWIESVGGELHYDAMQTIEVRLVPYIRMVEVNKEEAYHIAIDKYRVVVEAITPKGAYWALQTLKQLADPKRRDTQLEACEIIDWPAFRLRGFMHDTGRGYLAIDELKKEIELLSRFKINTFHWHLTENIGWRLESKRYPQLNDAANYERLPGKYYTLKEVRELVEYCKRHNVNVIPEIDMPGHSASFTRAFGTDMQTPEGMKILKELMDEVCEAFVGTEYIHIGTDEVNITNKEFVPVMVKYLRDKGKKVISWNPGWKYQKGEIDMLHLWSSRGKELEGVPAIDSRYHYANHFDSFADVVGLYNSSIANQRLGNETYAGAILAVWNDRALPTEKDIILQNAFYPSMLALAERTWIGGGEYITRKGTMIDAPGTKEFKDFEDFERRLLYYKKRAFKHEPFAYVKQTNVHWRITDAFANGGDVTKSFPPEQKLQPAYVLEDTVCCTRIATGAGIYLRHTWGSTIPAFYANPQPNSTSYAWTYVYSPKKQTVGAWIEFQNYGRSVFDTPPAQGKWDTRGSRIWINDNEILPPKWTTVDTKVTAEILLGNENFSARPPVRVVLNRGWNKVFMKLPVKEFSSSDIRLVKWMFTCVFVTLDGKDEVEGLIYSPDQNKKD